MSHGNIETDHLLQRRESMLSQQSDFSVMGCWFWLFPITRHNQTLATSDVPPDLPHFSNLQIFLSHHGKPSLSSTCKLRAVQCWLSLTLNVNGSFLDAAAQANILLSDSQSSKWLITFPSWHCSAHDIYHSTTPPHTTSHFVAPHFRREISKLEILEESRNPLPRIV